MSDVTMSAVLPPLHDWRSGLRLARRHCLVKARFWRETASLIQGEDTVSRRLRARYRHRARVARALARDFKAMRLIVR